jgi:hypothetical protein
VLRRGVGIPTSGFRVIVRSRWAFTPCRKNQFLMDVPMVAFDDNFCSVVVLHAFAALSSPAYDSWLPAASRRGEARPVDDEITVPGRKEGRGSESKSQALAMLQILNLKCRTASWSETICQLAPTRQASCIALAHVDYCTVDQNPHASAHKWLSEGTSLLDGPRCMSTLDVLLAIPHMLGTTRRDGSRDANRHGSVLHHWKVFD